MKINLISLSNRKLPGGASSRKLKKLAEQKKSKQEVKLWTKL
jgi:hypothetical protein